jgi:two-component system chemotaxis response regulator CheB
MRAIRPAVKRQSASTRSRAFELVALGASAGGLDVLNGLLAALPGDFAAAVMIVVHLPPDPSSYLVESFSHRSSLPVVEPDAGERILAGRVYVAPPGYHMLVEDDRTVALSIEAAVRFSRPSIDVMFESAAWLYRERMLAILLSGANEDGVHGLETVRAAGGAAWVQVFIGARNRPVAENAALRDRTRRSGRNSVSFYHGPPSCAVTGLYRT